MSLDCDDVILSHFVLYLQHFYYFYVAPFFSVYQCVYQKKYKTFKTFKNQYVKVSMYIYAINIH